MGFNGSNTKRIGPLLHPQRWPSPCRSLPVPAPALAFPTPPPPLPCHHAAPGASSRLRPAIQVSPPASSQPSKRCRLPRPSKRCRLPCRHRPAPTPSSPLLVQACPAPPPPLQAPVSTAPLRSRPNGWEQQFDGGRPEG
ncbi:lysine-rich arabinogalactan protein 18-like [Miscanthus floridulus]|uniref:lysine-rich arabinogalactan protein 18-like n=1 Tax=Miscanthus floridulus TaxID=154761 RepID=UPI003459FEFE